jgi:homogentisate solanesyltransferase
MSETVEKENAVPVADDVEDKAAFLEKRPEGSANRCSFMCLTSTANIGRALTAAVAKASVYQCAGKPFADPKACVGPLAADLVEYLAGDVGGGDPGEGAAGALSDLHSAMEAWTTSKKSWLGSVGETFSKASQADAIDALKSAVFKGEGWKVSDRERVSRELLLRVRHASCPNGSGVSRTAGFSVLLTRSVPSHFLLQYDRGKLAHCEEAFETADALYEHKLACAFRPVQCPNEGCAEVFGANAAGGHDALCAFKVLECPRGCGEGVTRRELEAHVTSTCAKRPVECPFRVARV